jgi:hypothetical protein
MLNILGKPAKVCPIVSLCISVLLLPLLLASPAESGESDAKIVQSVNAAVYARDQAILTYTVTEHYAMFRNHQEQRPVAEMTVQTTYKKDVGKSYAVLSMTGSALLRKVLATVLDNEKRLNEPANRASSLITSANYEMKPKGMETIGGRQCIAVELTPRHLSPYLLRGTLWVDRENGAIVQLSGISAKSPSVFTGPSQFFRQYAMIDGVAMATHARAESNSWMVGQTVITIDYNDYQIQRESQR